MRKMYLRRTSFRVTKLTLDTVWRQVSLFYFLKIEPGSKKNDNIQYDNNYH